MLPTQHILQLIIAVGTLPPALLHLGQQVNQLPPVIRQQQLLTHRGAQVNLLLRRGVQQPHIQHRDQLATLRLQLILLAGQPANQLASLPLRLGLHLGLLLLTLVKVQPLHIPQAGPQAR